MPTDYEAQLRAELEHHVDLLTADLARAGVPAHDARRRALIAFGGVEQVKEQCRDTQWAHVLRRTARLVYDGLRGR